MAGQLGDHQKGISLSDKKAMGFTPMFAKQRGGSGWGGRGDVGKGQVPGAQLILTAPDEVSKLLIV